jgi:hypothetical protein
MNAHDADRFLLRLEEPQGPRCRLSSGEAEERSSVVVQDLGDDVIRETLGRTSQVIVVDSCMQCRVAGAWTQMAARSGRAGQVLP